MMLKKLRALYWHLFGYRYVLSVHVRVVLTLGGHQYTEVHELLQTGKQSMPRAGDHIEIARDLKVKVREVLHRQNGEVRITADAEGDQTAMQEALQEQGFWGRTITKSVLPPPRGTTRLNADPPSSGARIH